MQTRFPNGIDIPALLIKIGGVLKTLITSDDTQTLTNKTLTAPFINNPYIVPLTVSHDYGAAAADWTLTAAERTAAIIKVTNASGAVNVIFNAGTQAYYLIDNQSGQALTCKNAAGTTIIVASTKRAIVWNDGTNIVRVTADA